MTHTPKKAPRTQGTRILDLCHRWQEDDVDWAHDRAIVSKYYSGVIAESEEDQDTLGLVDHNNLNIGRRGMIKARDETLAMFIKPRRRAILKFKDFDGTPLEKKTQEGLATAKIDEFLWKDPNMIHVVEALTDQHVAHGDSLLMFPPNGEGWRPFNARILTDPDAPQDPSDDNFMRWAVYSDLQLSEALRGIMNGDDGWESDAKEYLKGVWQRKYDAIDQVNGSYRSTFDDALELAETYPTEEEMMAQGSVGANLCDFVNTRLRCFYYYQKDFSDPENGTPVDMYVVARFETEDYDDLSPSKVPDSDPLLFKKKAAYESVDQALAEFVLDTNFGSEDRTWGTIKGLGHVNYNADRCVNLLMSCMLNASIDMNTPLMSVADEASVKQLQKFIKEGYRANQIIPAGASFVDKSKNSMRVGDAMNMVNFLQAETNRNAVGHTGQTDPSPDAKRIGVLQEQNAAQRTSSNRGDLLALRIDRFLKELYRRVLDSLKNSMFSSSDAEGVRELRKELRRAGVQLEWLRPENVDVCYARLIGEGDPAERTAKLERIIQRIGLVPAESRNVFLKEWLANASNWEFAEQAFEHASETSVSQQEKAQMKALAMMTTLTVSPVTPDDVPETQLRYIVQILQTLLDIAVQNGKFDSQMDIQGFVTVAQYGILLVQELEGRGQRDLAKSFSNEIQRITTEAQGPIANFNQSREAAESGQTDPKIAIEGAKLQLAQQKASLEERRFGAKLQKDAAVQQAQAQKQEVGTMTTVRDLHLREAAQRHRAEMDENKLLLERLKLAQQLDAQRENQQPEAQQRPV